MPARSAAIRPAAAIALWLLFAAYLAYVLSQLAAGFAAAASGGNPWFNDFTQTYASALIVRQGDPLALFSDDSLFAALMETARLAYGEGLSSRQAMSSLLSAGYWLYPPPFIFAIAPLAYLPYWLAVVLWLTLSGSLFLWAVRAALPEGAPWQGAWPLALGTPTCFANLMYGQTGFLSGGLIGLGLASIRRRPLLAGMLIGLASIKPHLGMLIPVALIAGSHWRAFVAATATTLGLLLASAAVFGLSLWQQTVATLLSATAGFSIGSYNLWAMTSVLSTVALLGGGELLMWTLQAIAAAAAVGCVAWVWHRGASHDDSRGLQAATLCFATPLAVPMVYVYDLAILIPGAAWLLADIARRGGSKVELTLLVIALALPFFSYELARSTGLQIGALPPLLLIGIALRRFLAAMESGARSDVDARIDRLTC